MDIITLLEHEMGNKLPLYIKNILIINGFDNLTSLSKMNNEIIVEIETMVQNELSKMIEQNELKSYLNVFKNTENFKFVIGHRLLLLEMAEIIRKKTVHYFQKKQQQPEQKSSQSKHELSSPETESPEAVINNESITPITTPTTKTIKNNSNSTPSISIINNGERRNSNNLMTTTSIRKRKRRPDCPNFKICNIGEIKNIQIKRRTSTTDLNKTPPPTPTTPQTTTELNLQEVEAKLLLSVNAWIKNSSKVENPILVSNVKLFDDLTDNGSIIGIIICGYCDSEIKVTLKKKTWIVTNYSRHFNAHFSANKKRNRGKIKKLQAEFKKELLYSDDVENDVETMTSTSTLINDTNIIENGQIIDEIYIGDVIEENNGDDDIDDDGIKNGIILYNANNIKS